MAVNKRHSSRVAPTKTSTPSAEPLATLSIGKAVGPCRRYTVERSCPAFCLAVPFRLLEGAPDYREYSLSISLFVEIPSTFKNASAISLDLVKG